MWEKRKENIWEKKSKREWIGMASEGTRMGRETRGKEGKGGEEVEVHTQKNMDYKVNKTEVDGR